MISKISIKNVASYGESPAILETSKKIVLNNEHKELLEVEDVLSKSSGDEKMEAFQKINNALLAFWNSPEYADSEEYSRETE
jgi:hypothetical protein